MPDALIPVTPAGTVSVIVTGPAASPPLFATVTVHEIGLPAGTEPGPVLLLTIFAGVEHAMLISPVAL